ncbi:protein LURP-one-related 5-like [Phalaenopsis equestris]|uniref:protein LURP-one-related 5-like n=1 Tax=Phalaenopsis equestris TaxID=78828 RepID=UPI0009E422A5|nr:protein LURP-one-related 5-like [Phalaenopsis equestris]
MRWTVWKRSSMGFVGMDGFSVYDADGKLTFRIDNYCRNQKTLLLMDAAGKPLLSLQPKMLSMHDQWDAYEGEKKKTRSNKPLFSMRRPSILHCQMDVAEVFMISRITDEEEPRFWVEGSFRSRSCRIIRQGRGNWEEMVAQITRKKANSLVQLGDDVFTLNVKAGVDCELIMAFVVVMDRICRK